MTCLTPCVLPLGNRFVWGDRKGQAYLHLDVEDAGAVLLGDVADGLDAGAVAVAAEFCVLDEAVCVYELEEFFFGDKVVLYAILLAAPGSTCGVFFPMSQPFQNVWFFGQRWFRTGNGEAKAVGIFFQQAVQVCRLAGARGPGDDYGTVGLFCEIVGVRVSRCDSCVKAVGMDGPMVILAVE